MLDRLAASIDRGMQIISDLFHAPVSGYCRLETVDGNALVADDGSLISVLRLEGSLKHVGVAEYNSIVSVLTEKLQSSLSRPGHVIQCVFEYDPDGSARRIDELLRPSRLTARGLGLHIDALLDDWSEALRTHCASEACFLVIWTRPNALENNLRKTAVAERRLAMSSVPNLPGCQNVCAALAGLRDAHNGFLSGDLLHISSSPAIPCRSAFPILTRRSGTGSSGWSIPIFATSSGRAKARYFPAALCASGIASSGR